MTRIGAFLLGLCLLLVGPGATHAAPSESWVISPQAPCTGLTVGWTPSLIELQQLVGPRWKPALGPVKDHGVLLLFAVSCPQSTVAGVKSGPFTIGAIIVPVETPRDTHGVRQSNAHGWAVVPSVFGRGTGAVTQLFKRHGFAVADTKVTLQVHDTTQGDEAEMSFVTSKGRMAVHAVVSGPAKRFDVVSALAGTHPRVFPLFTGRESASRQSQGTATVTAQGDTPITRLRLNSRPVMVILDRNFVWHFMFSDQPR